MAVREGMLTLLLDGPKHGYQLKTDFEAGTGDAWSLNVGQVYTTLDRLERDGFVATEEAVKDSRRGRVFSLTADGRAELEAWLFAPVEEVRQARDELTMRVLLAVRVEEIDAAEVIRVQRTALVTALQAHRLRSRTIDPQDLAAQLAADALAVRLEADVHWLDLCEQRLASTLTRPGRT